jgi:NADPH:quinone reductase-like Zn-dependent oxidoreductase
MKAITYSEYGTLERLETTDVPRPEPRSGEILVRVMRAALNPKDVLFRSGRFRHLSGSRFPKLCGVDFAGVVEETRSPHFRAGQRVFGMLDEVAYRRGTLAEFVACKDREAAAMPDGMSDEAGASLALVALTVIQAMRDIAHLGSGSNLLVHGGSGGVGTAAIQIARILGAEVDVTCSERNAAFCRELGAARVWDYATPALSDARPRFDVVFDAYGNLAFEKARPWLEPKGIFVTTTVTVGIVVRDILTRFSRIPQRFVAVGARREDLEQVASWAQQGLLRPVVDSRFDLAHFREAFARLESRRARGKIVVEIAEPAVVASS